MCVTRSCSYAAASMLQPASSCPTVAGALLERQLVVFCPNIGVLSMAVLSIVPLLRPYAWQSLMLPILPDNESMLHLLDAPVPFVIGIQVLPPLILEWYCGHASAPHCRSRQNCQSELTSCRVCA